MKCPHDLTDLRAHDELNPSGAQHCDTCNCCFDGDGSARAPFPKCDVANGVIAPPVVEDKAPPVEDDPSDAKPEGETPPARRTRTTA